MSVQMPPSRKRQIPVSFTGHSKTAESSLYKFLHVTLLGSQICKWLPSFWKNL